MDDVLFDLDIRWRGCVKIEYRGLIVDEVSGSRVDIVVAFGVDVGGNAAVVVVVDGVVEDDMELFSGGVVGRG